MYCRLRRRLLLLCIVEYFFSLLHLFFSILLQELQLRLWVDEVDWSGIDLFSFFAIDYNYYWIKMWNQGSGVNLFITYGRMLMMMIMLYRRKCEENSSPGNHFQFNKYMSVSLQKPRVIGWLNIVALYVPASRILCVFETMKQLGWCFWNLFDAIYYNCDLNWRLRSILCRCCEVKLHFKMHSHQTILILYTLDPDIGCMYVFCCRDGGYFHLYAQLREFPLKLECHVLA